MSKNLNKQVVLESCKRVLDSSIYVSLAEDLENKANCFSEVKSFAPFIKWKENELNPKVFNDFSIDWIFVCDLLNFSFWRNDEKEDCFDVEFNEKMYSGYWSLPATLNKFPRLVDPNFYSKITEEEFNQLFNLSIPLASERIRLLKEAGSVLVKDYNGSFSNYLKIHAKSNDPWLFIDSLIEDFPCFKDYNEEFSVWFLKRAQILVADLWAASEGEFFSETIKELTIFADYRIPQVLNSLGVLKYHLELQEKLKLKQLLPAGSREEIEIRAASIIACEKLKSILNLPNSVDLDFYIWEYSQTIKNKASTAPFHRTRSIFY